MKLSKLQECSKSFEENKEHMSFCNRSKICPKEKSYRGVWQRSSGHYVAQVWNPIQQKQKWLGTFDTKEEAAIAYDLAIISFKGYKVITNIMHPNIEIHETKCISHLEKDQLGLSHQVEQFPIET